MPGTNHRDSFDSISYGSGINHNPKLFLVRPAPPPTRVHDLKPTDPLYVLIDTHTDSQLQTGQIRKAANAECLRMISSFSDAGYLIPRLPHPRSCFF